MKRRFWSLTQTRRARRSWAFLAGLLSAILFAKAGFSNPVFRTSDFIAPVVRSPTAEERAIAKQPLPFAGVHIPSEIELCIGSAGERIDLLGEVKQRKVQFYLLNLYATFVDNNPLRGSDILIRFEQKTGCEKLLDSSTPKPPLSAYMPSVAALNLEQQRYRRYLHQSGGLDRFQQQLEHEAAQTPGPFWLSDEQIEAMRQLNIRPPDNYQSLTQTTFAIEAQQP